jgi:hypothetical protein
VSLSNPDIDLFKFDQLLRGYGQLFKAKMLPEGAASPVNMAKQLVSTIYKVKIYTDMYLYGVYFQIKGAPPPRCNARQANVLSK